jgi:O-acetyl-ADP-ribose deacetylase
LSLRAVVFNVRQWTSPIAHGNGFESIAFPLIGAGSGGFNQKRARAIMEDEFGKMNVPIEVKLVVYHKS